MERKAGRDMATHYAVAGAIQGRHDLECDRRHPRCGAGHRACAACFVLYGEEATHSCHQTHQEEGPQQQEQRTQQRPKAPSVEKPQEKTAALIEVQPQAAGHQFKFLLAFDALGPQVPAEFFSPRLDLLDLVLGQDHTGPFLFEQAVLPPFRRWRRLFLVFRHGRSPFPVLTAGGSGRPGSGRPR